MGGSAPEHDGGTGGGLTRQVAEFVAYTSVADLPAAVTHRSLCSILDGLGLALAGSVADTGRLVEDYLTRTAAAGAGHSTVIGRPLGCVPRFAAFANGVAIHADDFDDTQLASAPSRVYGLLTHPTAPALPAALAVAESVSASGADLLLAYNLGVEVETKVAEAIAPRHYQDGFHSTGTCGTFAAAAAAARLLRAPVDRIQCALSIAGSQAAGLRENFGTMTKPFHAGRAAESGVVAADLASLGWTAAGNILEAGRGFFQAAGGGYDRASIDGKLGDPWTFQHPGVSIKPHPSGSLTHPGMTALLELIRDSGVTAGQVARVVVGTNSHMPNALIHHRPQNALQAKFSMEFCMAILLLEGRAGLPDFTDATVMRPDVQELIRRVDFVVDPTAEAAGYDRMTTLITLELRNGETLTTRADFGKGSPANPMTFQEVAEKFRGCAEFARWPREKAELIIEQVEHLTDQDDLSTLCAALRP